LAKPTKLKNVVHRPALDYHQAAAFMIKLRKGGSMAAKALELQILTATRPGEVVGAAWSEFDLSGEIWTIPAERTKANKEHTIPLSPQAVKLLKKLDQVTDFVFPGAKLDKGMTTAAAMNLLKRIQPGITAHGFRSTFRDWAADQTSYAREVIEHAMAHRLKDKAEAAYFRSDQVAKRTNLMNDWAKFCDQVTAKSAGVTPIRKGAKS
jgi:integrase